MKSEEKGPGSNARKILKKQIGQRQKKLADFSSKKECHLLAS